MRERRMRNGIAPTGLARDIVPQIPTLKRGANIPCASGAGGTSEEYALPGEETEFSMPLAGVETE